jgi:hypothetical protein
MDTAGLFVSDSWSYKDAMSIYQEALKDGSLG